MALPSPSNARRGAWPHRLRARPNGSRRRARIACALAVLVSCTAPPELPRGRLARIETVPAGARLITRAGEVFRTPVELPLPEGATQYCEVRLRGYDRRRVAIGRPGGPTPLKALSMCTLVPLLAEARWERVDVVDGLARIDLVPTPGE